MADEAAPKILIIEDDADLAGLIKQFLEEHDFSVAIEGRGDLAIERILAEQPALVVLDLMLPGRDGLAVCRKVRQAYTGQILILTARREEADEVMGLESGADDYVMKPVKPRVLLARIRALLRRPAERARAPEGLLQVGEITVDIACRSASVNGAKLSLTSGEFDLLWLLASNAGQTMSRKVIHERLRNEDYEDFDRAIDLRVSRLRHKLSAACGREIVKTVRGVGYLCVAR